MARKKNVVEILGAPKLRNGLRLCDAPGCDELGEHRAPRSRDDLNNYYWFCMGHVRAYNARWNFYAGLNQQEIEKQIRADTTWWRPTWPLGGQNGRRGIPSDGPILDFGVFGHDEWDQERIRSNGEEPGWRPRPGSEESEALAILNLDAPVTRDDIKSRYKDLVKRHHPDANGGNKEAEERLKVINRAYSVLRTNSEI